MQAAPKPKTLLGHYKVLSPNAGVRVSPLCLGTMNYGKAWEKTLSLGECSKESAFEIMDTFYEGTLAFRSGGNFIDTADNYQDGESEQWVGEWMELRKNREEIVLATKYTSPIHPPNGGKIYINHAGNSRKSLLNGVTSSLKNLRTSYIDVLYVHWWDYTTSIQELMQSLHALVVSGKVLYLGASDMPAWVVAAANTYAQENCLTPFAVYQGKWNLEERDVERDVLQMCKQFGLGFAAWNVMGGGRYKVDEKKAREGSVLYYKTDNHDRVAQLLDDIGNEIGATRQQICIAYVITKYPRTFPILGGRKAAHLVDNIKALDLLEEGKFTQKHVHRIEQLSPVDMGFPHNLIGMIDDRSGSMLLANSGVLQNLLP
ncbi:hypothetical protein RI367_001111 [Sorochytrium milnesiophthora]